MQSNRPLMFQGGSPLGWLFFNGIRAHGRRGLKADLLAGTAPWSRSDRFRLRFDPRRLPR